MNGFHSVQRCVIRFDQRIVILDRKKPRAALLHAGVFLLGVIHSLGLADEVDFDLAGVFQLGFDLLGDVVGQQSHIVLGDVLGSDHDADLAAGLDGVGLLHAGEGARELLPRGRPGWRRPSPRRGRSP